MTDVFRELAELGTATVHEAGGRAAVVDVPLVQVVAGSRAAGPARTVRCGQGDNLMVHAAVAEARPGEVLVLTMPDPEPVALVGELIATQAKVRGVAALLVDAAVRDVEELQQLGLPIWARYVRVRGAEKKVPGRIGEPVEVGGATIRQGDAIVLDADGAVVVEQERVEEVLAAARDTGRARAREARKASGGRALLRPRRPPGARGAGTGEAVTEPLHDVARIAHAELLTPKPEESLRFFVDVLGLEEEAREGQSVYLRGWGDYLRYSLKLTESPQPGLGHVALRAWSPSALDRRVAAIEESGLGVGWLDGDVGHGPAYRFTDPDGHVFEILYEAERYTAPEHLRPSWRNQPQRYIGRGAAVKRLDHVNVLAADVRANRTFAQDVLGYRLYERIELDDGTETGAWLSLSIAAHELIYVADAYGASGRLHHLAFWVDTREECLRAADLFVENDVPIEAAPSKHGVAQGFFLYGFEPGGNRIEVTTGGYFVYDPDWEPIVWSAEERARGQYWGVKTIESFHTYGTPDVETGPPDMAATVPLRERLGRAGDVRRRGGARHEPRPDHGRRRREGARAGAGARGRSPDRRALDHGQPRRAHDGGARRPRDRPRLARPGGDHPPRLQGLESQRAREPRLAAELGRLPQRARPLRRLPARRPPGSRRPRVRHRLGRPAEPLRRDERGARGTSASRTRGSRERTSSSGASSRTTSATSAR